MSRRPATRPPARPPLPRQVTAGGVCEPPLVPAHVPAGLEHELLMTLGQSLIGMLFLVNMELTCFEASALFVLWGLQFALSPDSTPSPSLPRRGLLTSW